MASSAFRQADGGYLGYRVEQDRHAVRTTQGHVLWRAYDASGVPVAASYRLDILKSLVRRRFLANKLREQGVKISE